MPEPLEKKVDELREEVSEIRTALKGYNGGQGLIPAFREHCERDEQFRKDYYSFRRRVLAVFFFLLGSGIFGAGGIKAFEYLAK